MFCSQSSFCSLKRVWPIHPVLVSLLHTIVKDALKKISCTFLKSRQHLHEAWLQDMLGEMIFVRDSV